MYRSLSIVGVILCAIVLYSQSTFVTKAFESVEVRFSELSPLGEDGGYAVPASGSSDPPSSMPAATNPSSWCSGDGTQGSFSWTAPDGYDTFYTRSRVNGVNFGWDDNFVGTSKNFSTTPGATYEWWVHTKNIWTGEWSDAVGGTFTCPVPPRPDLVANWNAPWGQPINTAAIPHGTNPINFGGGIGNAGAANSGAFYARIEIDNRGNQQPTYYSEWGWYGGVASGAWDLVGPIPFYNNLSAGTYNARICADVGGHVAESDEGNNCGDWHSFQVQSAGPTSMSYSCSANGRSVTLSWAGVAGASVYYPRIAPFSQSECTSGLNWSWMPDAGGVCHNNTWTYGTVAANIPITPGKTYSAWVHAGDPVNYNLAAGTGNFSCTAPPVTNQNGWCSADGTLGTITWAAPSDYNTFYTRVSTDGGANWPSTPGTDDNFVGTSKTFPTTPGQAYSWWVHTKVPENGSFSDARGGSFTCPAPVPDVCPNIAGAQATIPTGMVKDAGGNCITPNAAPYGWIDGISCSTIDGWAVDSDVPGNAIGVRVTDSQIATPLFDNFTTNITDAGLNTILGSAFSGAHRFSIPTPAALKNSGARTVRVYGLDAGGGPNAELQSSPRTVTLACYPPPPPTINYSCAANGQSVTFSWSTAVGATKYYPRYWIEDTNASCAPGWTKWTDGHTCFIDNVVGTSVTAAITPGVHYGGPYVYSGDPVDWSKSTSNAAGFTCVAPNGPPFGYFDTATCSALSGWAYDTDNATASVAVHIYEGSTFVAGIPATNITRNDVNTAIGITGVHGFSITTPDSLKDNNPHTLKAFAIDSNGGSPRELQLSPRTVTCAPQRPNLISHQPSFTTSSSTKRIGASFTFNATTRNVGTVALTSGAYSDAFQWSASASGPWSTVSSVAGTPLGVFPGGANGGAHNETGTFTPASTGTFYVRHCADAAGQINNEISESDNCTTPLTITVLSAQGAPTVACSVNPASPVAVGTPVTFTASPAGGTAPYSYEWWGTDGLGLTGNGSTITKTYNTAGTKLANIRVRDALGIQSAPSACADMQVSAAPQPNLVSELLSVTGGTTQPKDTLITFTATTRNAGTATAQAPYTDAFYYNLPSLPGKGTPLNVSGATLAPGQARPESASVSFTTPGVYHIRHCTDVAPAPNGAVIESNELDNCTGPLTLVITGGTVAATCSVTPPSPVNLGAPVQWSASASGGTAPYTYTWTGTDGLANVGSSVSKIYTTAGTKSASVYARDALGLPSAWVSCPNLQVSAGVQPNLISESLAVTGGTTHAANTPVTFTATTRNSGIATATAPYTDRFYYNLASLSGRGTPLNVTGVTLAPGQSNPESTAVTFSTPGTYRILHCTDVVPAPNGTVVESNELDNCSEPLTLVITGVVNATCAVSPTGTVDLGTSVTWTATPAGGTTPYTYEWSGDETLTGTTQSVSKVYRSVGAKKAFVTVEDNLGLSSGSIACDTTLDDDDGPVVVVDPNPPSATLEVSLTGLDAWSGDDLSINLASNPSPTIDLRWSSTNATRCDGDGFSTGGATSGTRSAIVPPLPPASVLNKTYRVTCYNSANRRAEDSLNVAVVPVPGTPHISVNPERVRQGGKTQVSADVSGQTGCTVVAAGQSTKTDSSSAIPSEYTSDPINGETTFTLSCTSLPGVSSQATVRLYPKFEEI